MAERRFQLMSEFYLQLWGELDVLFDEHRWIRCVGEASGGRDAKQVLAELYQANTSTERMKQLHNEFQDVKALVKDWRSSDHEERERNELRRRVEAKRSYLQEKALAFGAFASPSQLGS